MSIVVTLGAAIASLLLTASTSPETCDHGLSDLESAGYETKSLSPTQIAPELDLPQGVLSDTPLSDDSVIVVPICGSELDPLRLSAAELSESQTRPVAVILSVDGDMGWLIFPQMITSHRSQQTADTCGIVAISNEAALSTEPAVQSCGLGVVIELQYPIATGSWTEACTTGLPLDSPELLVRDTETGETHGSAMTWQVAKSSRSDQPDICSVDLLLLSGPSRSVTFNGHTGLVGPALVDISSVSGTYSAPSDDQAIGLPLRAIATLSVLAFVLGLGWRRPGVKAISSPQAPLRSSRAGETGRAERHQIDKTGGRS